MTEPITPTNAGTPAPKPKIRLNAMLSNKDRATVTTIGFALAAVILLFYLLTLYNFTGLIDDFMHGRHSGAGLYEAGESLDNIFKIYLGIIVLNAIFFISWFYRAYWNLENCGWPRLTLFGSGWAIGSWFVPFLNLVRPVKMAYEIGEGMQKIAFVRKKEDLYLMQPLTIIGVWWGFYLAHNFLLRIGAKMVENGSKDSVMSGLYVMMFAVILGIIALACCFFMVRKISGYEAQALQRHNEEVANQDNPFVDAKAVTPAINGPNAPTANDPFA